MHCQGCIDGRQAQAEVERLKVELAAVVTRCVRAEQLLRDHDQTAVTVPLEEWIIRRDVFLTPAPGTPEPATTPCPCASLEDVGGNAEVECHRCHRAFRGNVCVACAGSGRVSLDPATEWQATTGRAPVAKVATMLAPECPACKGFGATTPDTGEGTR
jgi:hypothetical protein